jgi:hypothetical protein
VKGGALCCPAAVGSHLQNTFEFKIGAQQPVMQPSSKPYTVNNPFTAGLKQQAPIADSTRMMDQRASPEPATPASITSESRGGLAGPPLTTLASLNKLATSDSDTLTPMTNMHASHVPLSTYSGTPDAVRNAAKQPRKLVWGDILMWKQPMQSATIFIAGLAGFGLLNFAAYGAHKMTLMSGRGPINTRHVSTKPDLHAQCANPTPEQQL